jgi:prevent-host-death family protein
VSITQFNKGKASQLFARANNGETLLVIKNNTPVAVVLSPEEYEMLRKIPRICRKTIDNVDNVRTNELTSLLDELDAFDENGEKNV